MSEANHRIRFRYLAVTVELVASALLLEWSASVDVPFVVFFLVACAWTTTVAWLSHSELLRNGALICCSVLFSMAVVETCMYYANRSRIIITRTIPIEWRGSETDVGSLPGPNSTTAFEEFLGGRLIADVTYRFDGNGLRQIPAAVQGRPYKVVFFGCSFMFGHGVQDDQTLPYYFVQEAKGSFEGFNFAGDGWGPHQMLRQIETGFVRRVAGTPDLAIYEAIPDHLRRVAGRAPWEDGPKYDLCRGDEACYSGSFHNIDYEIYRHWLDRSWTVKFFETHFAELSRPSDIPLFLAVLKRTRTLLESNGTRFVIVLWDQNELAKTMMKTLRANQFDVIALSSVFPESDLENGLLTQGDRHPSPATDKAIATYLWQQIGEPLAYAKHSR
jgi:hypothetical protein